MFGKVRRLMAQKQALENRVYELEQILCPCQQHDWVEVDHRTLYGVPIAEDVSVEYTYQCKRCKKIKVKTEF